MCKKILVALLGVAALPALASTCQMVNYQSGDVIDVKTSVMLGSRIQLPANLIKPPLVTNGQNWDVEGAINSNQIMIAPLDERKGGESTMVFAYTDDGKVFDIVARRVSNKDNEPCVIIGSRAKFTYAAVQYEPKRPKITVPPVKRHFKPEKKIEDDAINKYRKQIFTRYNWSENIFSDELISDVYDDGRRTYVRLVKPNQTIKITATVNGKEITIPVVADKDNSTMFNFAGVHSKFVVNQGSTNITVTR